MTREKKKKSCNIWKKFQVIFFLMHWLKLFLPLNINEVRTFYPMILFFLKFYIWIGPWESWNPFKKFSENLWNVNSLKAKQLSCHFLFLVTRARPGNLVLVLSSVECKRGLFYLFEKNELVVCEWDSKRVIIFCKNKNNTTRSKPSYPHRVFVYLTLTFFSHHHG